MRGKFKHALTPAEVMGVTLQMQQEKALKILAEHRQSLADKYGIKKIGVFPYSHNANCDCRCRNCCGYHPQIGVAVEYMPDAAPGWDFYGLEQDIADILGCDILLLRVDGHRDTRFWRDDTVLEEVAYLK